VPQAQIIQNWEPANKKIIIGHFDRKISTFFEAEDKNEQFQSLHKLIVKWTVLTGVKPLPNKHEIKLFVEYIAEHFYRLSLMEIDNAFNLATAGKLDIEAEHYQSFSVIYISKIINSYGRYIGKYILEYLDKLEEEQKENDKPSEKEQLELILESILENFEEYKENYLKNGEPIYNPFGYISYDYLKKLGLIHLEDELKEELLEQAKEIALKELRDKRSSYKESETQAKFDVNEEIQEIINNGKQDRVMRICKNLGLIHYYEDILKNNLSLDVEISLKHKVYE
jgi:hypothetical protein|tara:strand:+ start:224 stop:1072 length:849 start_codon:yes stop_codon:yes gene_type:complete